MTANHSQQIVQKLWSYCNLLRDDGLSYGDYVEQLTYLLFLKMAHEQTLPPWRRPSPMPDGYDWPSLLRRDGDDLEIHYRHLLEELGKQPGMLGIVFRKSQNKVQDPAKLRRLIVALIKAMVDVIRPAPGETICDPACGTGGFLLAAHDYVVGHNPNLDPDQRRHLKLDGLRGVDIVDNVVRLCAMNLLLHGIGPTTAEGTPPVAKGDSLAADPGDRYDVVLTNPPFGKKSSVLVVNDAGEQEREDLVVLRDDFWASTSNKQLNFVQHVKTLLEINGRAAVVVPDNVLFEGGAGETVRRKLLHECDVHTLLRLPTGIFYAQGVKANVVFFDRKPASETPWTKTLWIYDLRTNMHFTLKTNPLKRADLDDFVACYHPENRHDRRPSWSPDKPDGRWRPFAYDELLQRDTVSLDLFWLKDESLEDSATLADPDLIAAEIAEDLRAALEEFETIQAELTAP
jgi:type I restriction enzyme M protein